MKCFAFPEIWVQKQRYHPSLARAQCASLCRGFSHVTLLYHCHMPPHLQPPSAPVPLRADILPQQGQPIRTLDSQSREAAVKSRVRLLPSGSPRGVQGQARSSLRREYGTLSVGPGSGARARSLRPAMLLFAELCGWDFGSTD